MMVLMGSANTVIQTIVDDEKRGRVMSFYTMTFLGTAPFGSLAAGALSNRIGAPHTVLLSGVLCGLIGVWFSQELPAIRAVVRPIYARMGILPEVATGLQSASNSDDAAGTGVTLPAQLRASGFRLQALAGSPKPGAGSASVRETASQSVWCGAKVRDQFPHVVRKRRFESHHLGSRRGGESRGATREAPGA